MMVVQSSTTASPLNFRILSYRRPDRLARSRDRQEVEILAHVDGLQLSNMTTSNNDSGNHSSLNEYSERAC